MKYIMFEDFSGNPLPIIFPNRIAHDELRKQIPYSTILSAGYIKRTETGFACFGKAKDLGKEASPEDEGLIMDLFRKNEDDE
ncbi:hypothetical protein [Desulfoplanes formicivorans]|uniref:Uncharacterized protein n=1 Tax=Desulfoplanes formicivorans TaxID=1592317 RepID=A0A194AIX3_9BACT|nr:hypothetical protein [Desulfoplanes formicivorans]GAU09278.1 hypothetical protein DPF_2000 [Desulfoplanes formicivorans]